MTELASFQQRAQQAEDQIRQLSQRLNLVQSLANERYTALASENAKLKAEIARLGSSSSSTSSSSSRPITSRIPVGHTAFSWGPLNTSAPLERSDNISGDKQTLAQSLLTSAMQGSTPNKFHDIISIKTILKKGEIGSTVTVGGWAKTVRLQGGGTFAFVELNDGSCLGSLQIIVDQNKPGFVHVNGSAGKTGLSLLIRGKLVPSPGKEQAMEMQAEEVDLLGACDSTEYPLAKKQHTLVYLRTIAHLRPRTNTIGAVTRVRNAMAYATHKFYQENDYLYVHTPIITGSDCEGAGELFNVTSLINPTRAVKDIPVTPKGTIDYSKDFFSQPAFLTVSGQLSIENYACSLGKCYTFGPTFRAEDSNTKKHLSEFWMIEPEIPFADLSDLIAVAEGYLKYLVSYALEHCAEDLAFFEKLYEKGLIDRLSRVASSPFLRVSYTAAVDELIKSKHTFEVPPVWGLDLATEHERYLSEQIYKQPVVVYDYPRDFKAFYMRVNPDGKTVAAMDVLVPSIGEIIGGSQREERYDVLAESIRAKGMNVEDYKAYLDLRKYGSVPHSGFGLGFERLMMFVTGIENIRDVIPAPRYPGHTEF